jgi:transposase-like protein
VSNAQDGDVSIKNVIDNHKTYRSAMSTVHNVGNTTKSTRRSYSREKKLEVISWYKNNGKNKYQTCKKFGIPRKCMATWLKMENEILKMTEGQLARRGGKVNWPDMEQELYQRFIKVQKNEVEVKKKWFEKEAFDIMTQLYPDVNFKFSAGWFRRFKMRNKIP